jgi:hypothetical protein
VVKGLTSALVSLALTAVAAATDIPRAEELLALDGSALLERVSKTDWDEKHLPYNAAELIAISAKLAPTVKPILDSPIFEVHPFGMFFSMACDLASADQFPQVVEIYARLDVLSLEKMQLLSPLTASWLRSHLAAMPAGERNVRWRSKPTPSVLSLSGVPESLADAWRLYEQATASYRQHFAASEAEGDIGKTGDVRLLFQLVEGALVGKSADAVRELPKYRDYSAHCMGDPIGDIKTAGMLIALMGERRYEEAIGAALNATASE